MLLALVPLALVPLAEAGGLPVEIVAQMLQPTAVADLACTDVTWRARTVGTLEFSGCERSEAIGFSDGGTGQLAYWTDAGARRASGCAVATVTWLDERSRRVDGCGQASTLVFEPARNAWSAVRSPSERAAAFVARMQEPRSARGDTPWAAPMALRLEVSSFLPEGASEHDILVLDGACADGPCAELSVALTKEFVPGQPPLRVMLVSNGKGRTPPPAIEAHVGGWGVAQGRGAPVPARWTGELAGRGLVRAADGSFEAGEGGSWVLVGLGGASSGWLAWDVTGGTALLWPRTSADAMRFGSAVLRAIR